MSQKYLSSLATLARKGEVSKNVNYKSIINECKAKRCNKINLKNNFTIFIVVYMIFKYYV